MNTKVESDIRIVVSLTVAEAKIIAGLVQNGDPIREDVHVIQVRYDLFESLKAAIEKAKQ